MTRTRTHKLFRLFEPVEGRVLFAAGDLDPTFGSGGVTSFDYGEKEGAADVII